MTTMNEEEPFYQSFIGLSDMFGETFRWYDLSDFAIQVFPEDEGSEFKIYEEGPEFHFFDSLRTGDPSLVIAVDKDREVWFADTGGELPFALWEQVFPWSLYELSITFLREIEYLETVRGGRFGSGRFDQGDQIRLALAFLKWTACVRVLCAIAVGELDEELSEVSPTAASANRSAARDYLKVHASSFWEWTTKREINAAEVGQEIHPDADESLDIPNLETVIEETAQLDFDDEGWNRRMLGFGYLRAKFRGLGFLDGYRFDPFQELVREAQNIGEDLASATIDLAMARKNATPSPNQNKPRDSSRLRSWLIPLIVGTLIAIGALNGW